MHDSESLGAKPRDHVHPRRHFLRRAHRDWRVWVGLVLMLAMVLVYELSDNLALWPGHRAGPPTPAAVAP